MTALLNAMRILTDPEKAGGVCIMLPQDVQGEAFAYPEYFFQKRVHRIPRQVPQSEEIAQAVQMIRKKKHPLVILGGGVRYSEAGEQLAEFCETFRIPFAETQSGKSVLPSSHPLNLGGIGVTGNSAANTIAAKADLVIGDAKAAFEQLQEELLKQHYQSTYTTEIKEAKEQWQRELERLTTAVYNETYRSNIRAKEPGVEQKFVGTTPF